jgi:hypothetical protein
MSIFSRTIATSMLEYISKVRLTSIDELSDWLNWKSEDTSGEVITEESNVGVNVEFN